MFGLIYAAIGLIGKIGYKIEESVDNYGSYSRTYNPKTDSYMDRYGVERRPNGAIVHTYKDWQFSGDYIQEDVHGNVIRNFSEEERWKEIRNNPGKHSVIAMPFEPRHTMKSGFGAYGRRYKDLKTGDLYVIRPIKVNNKNSLNFYMNAESGMLVRLTDGQKEFEKKAKDNNYFYYSNADIDNTIKDFNTEQVKNNYKKKELDMFYYLNEHDTSDIKETDWVYNILMEQRRKANEQNS